MSKSKASTTSKVKYGGFGPLTHPPAPTNPKTGHTGRSSPIATVGGKIKRASAVRKEGRKERAEITKKAKQKRKSSRKRTRVKVDMAKGKDWAPTRGRRLRKERAQRKRARKK